jgi:hypothetical protein
MIDRRRPNIYLQYTTEKTNDWATWTPLSQQTQTKTQKSKRSKNFKTKTNKKRQNKTNQIISFFIIELKSAFFLLMQYHNLGTIRHPVISVLHNNTMTWLAVTGYLCHKVTTSTSFQPISYAYCIWIIRRYLI